MGEFKRAFLDYTSLALRLDVGPSSVREAATAESATDAGVAGSIVQKDSGRTVPALTISAQQQVGPKITVFFVSLNGRFNGTVSRAMCANLLSTNCSEAMRCPKVVEMISSMNDGCLETL